MIRVNILFANDDVLTQWVMTEVLQGAGFGVVSVCRGKDVIDLLEDAPEFDLLLTDLDLVDASRVFEIGHYWRRARPGRPVIYTGASREALLQPLLLHETFLQTPFTADTLLRAIDLAFEEVCFGPLMPARALPTHHVH